MKANKSNAYIIEDDLTNFDNFFLEQLKIKLSNHVGYLINSKNDCAKLSERISNNGYGYISQSTLYRMFFQQGKHKPYKHTIELLCIFLGYKNIEVFTEEIELKIEKGLSINNKKNNLLLCCIETASYKPLSIFFDRMNNDVEEVNEYIGLQIYDCLQQVNNPNSFLKYYANHSFVREYFFEKCHDPKFRIKNYDLGYRHYLNKTNNNNAYQDFVFGNCVLLRHYFLANQYEDAKGIAKVLYSDEITTHEIRQQLNIFPFVRFLAYKIWFLQLNNASKITSENYAHFLLDYCISLKKEMSECDKRILFHTIAEAFIYSNLPSTFHDTLREIFSTEIVSISPTLYQKDLKQCLRYFEPNGLLIHRP